MRRRQTIQKYNRRIALWYCGINSYEYTFVCDTFEVGFGFGVSVLHGWQRWLFTRALQKYGKQTIEKETPKSFCVNGIISFQHAQSE